jgi:outer membrane protein
MRFKTTLLTFLAVFALFTAQSFAQSNKVGYVDIDKVLKNIPDYQKAQTELEQQAEIWRKEIAKEYEKIEATYRDFQAREVLLSDEARKQKRDEITNAEKVVRELQKKRFGPDGELFQKRQTLVKPIQEKVFTAIKKLAEERQYDFIFTAPDGSTVIYAKADKDLTDEVIKKIK